MEKSSNHIRKVFCCKPKFAQKNLALANVNYSISDSSNHVFFVSNTPVYHLEKTGEKMMIKSDEI